MNPFHLFLFFLICIGCTNQIKEKTNLLDKELAITPILSLKFDSLLIDIKKLPTQQQVNILLQISHRDEEDINGMLKQERLLLNNLHLFSKKKILFLQLLDLYEKLNEQRHPDADIKGLKLIKELETNHSLSQEEEWKIKKTKAILLAKRGFHEQYLPIWFDLLSEHRAAGKSEYVINDLITIANQVAILGDREKGISLYKEAYQLSIDNDFSGLGNKCLIQLIYLLYDSKQYSEVLNYSIKIGLDSAASYDPSIYNILQACYLKLHKPDSARYYLNKMSETSKQGNGMIFNRRMADTYIAENRIDSALVYLDKAIDIFKSQTERFQEKNIKTSLPFYFLPTYSTLASLYQQSGNYQQAGKSFTMVEPLMKKVAKEPFRLEMQIDALTRYSSFCRVTKQYEKAIDLMVYRDSIQQIVNKANKERENKNLMDRLQIADLMHTIRLKEVELIDSQRWLAAISGCAFLAFSLIAAIFYIIRQRRKRIDIVNSKEKEIERLKSAVTSKDEKTMCTMEKRFHMINERVQSEKLFLDKQLSLKSLAKLFDTNRSDLSACINTYSGVNFNQWINDFRIDYLLERIYSDEKISKLAEDAGFVSSDSFYRNFKRKTNLTPKEYLKQHPPK